MTRTEQFLEGYNSFRRQIQGVLKKYPSYRKAKLIKLAMYPYYNDDGADWCLKCDTCKHYTSGWEVTIECQKFRPKIKSFTECNDYEEEDNEQTIR